MRDRRRSIIVIARCCPVRIQRSARVIRARHREAGDGSVGGSTLTNHHRPPTPTSSNHLTQPIEAIARPTRRSESPRPALPSHPGRARLRARFDMATCHQRRA